MSSSPPTHTAMANNLARLLPSGTFLTFSTLAPLFTNNGSCGPTERVMTGLLMGTFVALVFALNFVDSVTTESGRVYYGVVTSRGLYNPQFAKSSIPGDLRRGDSYFTGGVDDDDGAYDVNLVDVLNGLLDVVAFATLAFFGAPITFCYYPNIPGTVTKTVPILVALIVGVFFAFAPQRRRGIGFAVTNAGFQLVPEQPVVATRVRGFDPRNTDLLLEETRVAIVKDSPP